MAAAEETVLYQRRIPVYPRSVKGRFRRLKYAILTLAYCVYFVLPWIRWERANGIDQAVSFDIANRRFYLFDLVVDALDIYWLAGFLVILLFGVGACGESRDEVPEVPPEESLRAARADSVAQAMEMYDRGQATKEDIDAGMRGGCAHPMGPLELSDLIDRLLKKNARQRYGSAAEVEGLLAGLLAGRPSLIPHRSRRQTELGDHGEGPQPYPSTRTRGQGRSRGVSE